MMTNEKPGDVHKIVMFGDTISLKNSKKIIRVGGFPKIVPSDAYQNWASEVLPYLMQSDLVGHQWDYPVTVDFAFYRKTLRKFDFINLGQGPLDLMIEARIIEDDDMAHVIPGTWAWHHDKENPRVEIFIYGK